MELIYLIIVSILFICFSVPVKADDQLQKEIILDTDVGDDIDDAFAISLALCSPELKIIGITTAHGPTDKRAKIVCKMLYEIGRSGIPVAMGKGSEGNPNQAAWAENFTKVKPIEKPAADFIIEKISEAPGKITLIPIGPLTNIADVINKDSTAKNKVKEIILMGGSAYIGYNSQPPPVAEYNIRADVSAAKTVFTSGIPITMVGLDVTAMLQLDADKRRRIAECGTPLTNALTALYRLWKHETPTLFDPMAVSVCIDKSFCQIEMKHVEVDDEGRTLIIEGKEPNVAVCTKPDKERFFKFYMERVCHR